MPPLKLRPTIRKTGADAEMLFMLGISAAIGLFALGIMTAPLFTVIAIILTTGLVFGWLNRRLISAYRNNHTSFTEIEVDVTAANRVYHIMEQYDEGLDPVSDDIVAFLEEAEGVTPVTTDVWQRKATEGGFLTSKGRKDATITVTVGYDSQDINIDALLSNLKKAVRTDDRVAGFRDVRIGVQQQDIRQQTGDFGNDYRELGSDVEAETPDYDELLEQD